MGLWVCGSARWAASWLTKQRGDEGGAREKKKIRRKKRRKERERERIFFLMREEREVFIF